MDNGWTDVWINNISPSNQYVHILRNFGWFGDIPASAIISFTLLYHLPWERLPMLIQNSRAKVKVVKPDSLVRTVT